MNFTGSSTYTSLSGVRKEMKLATSFSIGFFSIGFDFTNYREGIVMYLL